VRICSTEKGERVLKKDEREKKEVNYMKKVQLGRWGKFL